MRGRIVLQEGDITEAQVDAIVNAANSRLELGAGVAGAIREKGGPAIQAECDAIGPIAVGEAALTGAGALPARHVIHAAGMALGGAASEESVRSSMRRSLELARELGCRSIAVPAIGAGAGGVSTRRCAEVLIAEAWRHLSGETTLAEIRFVLFGEPTFRIFEMVNDRVKIEQQMQRMRRS